MLLEVRDLCVNYGRIEAIRNISFTVEEGEVVTLIGANGAGKTTTMKTISGLRPGARGDHHLRRSRHHLRARAQAAGVGDRSVPEGRGCFPG
jgi:branched-chain amino acid transport system ATP-binding protein